MYFDELSPHKNMSAGLQMYSGSHFQLQLSGTCRLASSKEYYGQSRAYI